MTKARKDLWVSLRLQAPRPQRGFSLIEIMVVLAIVAILMALVVPSYTDGLRKGRRADARAALSEMATKQEKYFSQKNAYTTLVAEEGTGLSMGQTTSNSEFYNLTAAACTGGTIARCYLLTAKATGGQEQDTDCVTFTLDSAGRKLSYAADGTKTSEKCW